MGKRGVDWLLRSRKTGKITIAQVPNLPLVLFGVFRLAETLLSPHGTWRDVLYWAGTAALAWWALAELLQGVNPFRRLLGAAVLMAVIL